MHFESSESLLRVASPQRPTLVTLANLVLVIGCAALVLPTMYEVARQTWTTDQGGHGPLVLATGLWALWRELHNNPAPRRPGNLWIGLPLLAISVGLFMLARITGVLEIEAFTMYGALVSALYLLFGGVLLRSIWFPLVYLAFSLPPPDTVVAAITQPIKIAISHWAVSLLYFFGYPVAQSGVVIQIGQYQLLVAAACAGLNSIETLAALCLFYAYLTHRSSVAAFFLVGVAAIPVAIVSNFVRVMALVLVTYYFGDAAGQGFVHDFAGLLMFGVALLTIFAIDRLVTTLFARHHSQAAA